MNGTVANVSGAHHATGKWVRDLFVIQIKASFTAPMPKPILWFGLLMGTRIGYLALAFEQETT